MQLFTRTLLLGTIILMTACGESSSPTEPAKLTATEKPDVQIEDEQTPSSGDNIVSETITLAGVTLQVQAKGTMEPKNQYQLSFGLIKGEQGAIIRLWIGEESRVGSLVYKAHSHGDHYHGSAEVPDEINPKTALWLEVQSVSGEKETGSIPLQ
jgi:hypothetical protein